MSAEHDGRAEVPLESLVEVWKVLEALRVSLDRIGAYSYAQGEEAMKDALTDYMGPDTFRRISNAWGLLTRLLEEADPSMTSRLERLAEDKTGMGYWEGLDADPSSESKA